MKGVKVRGGTCGRHSALPLLALFVALAAVSCAAAPMELVRRAETVAGIGGRIGHVDGPPGTSMLRQPRAVCGGRNSDEILIGDLSYFRAYSRTTSITSTLLGGADAGHVDGQWDLARVDKPNACLQTTVNNVWVVYFVEGTNSLRYILQNIVGSVTVSSDSSLTSVVRYGNTLYLTDEIMDRVWSCSVDPGVVPRNCRVLDRFSCGMRSFSDIAVTARGVFVLSLTADGTSGGICWFTANGDLVSTLGVKYVSIFSLASGALYAATANELHHITVNGSTLEASRFAGSAAARCPPSSTETNVVLCQMLQLYVIAENEMYVTTGFNIMQSITLPPAIVSDSVPRQPLPLGFPDEDAIMPDVIARMNHALDRALGTNDTVVNPRSMSVNEAWETNFSVLVQQSNFDNDTTPGAVQGVVYTNATDAVQRYYNLTDEVLYTDTSILPYCDAAMLRSFEVGVVERVRSALVFPFVYCNAPAPVTINTIQNITTVKLLMPATFANETTRITLGALNLSDLAVNVVRELYSPNHRIKLVFPDSPYNFDGITEEQMQSLRWIILSMVRERLDRCGELSGEVNPGSCHAVITNRTVVRIVQPPFNTESEYEVFVPDRFEFNLAGCVNGIDWTPFQHALYVFRTMNENSMCNRGCIIGVSIAAALVLAALIALAVVLTSKRRRLATVVAPSRPKFVSTLDNYEHEMASNNPLGGRTDEQQR